MSFGLTKVFSKHGGRIIEKWIFDAKSPLVCPATVTEINGKAQVIIGTKNGTILCVDDTGKERWSFGAQEKLGTVESFFVDQERVHSIDAPPVIADVNRDGKMEILAGTEYGTLYCLSTEGQLLWKHECGGSIKASCLVADINMDGQQEILIGSTNNKITALSGQGKVLFEYMTDAPVESVPGLLRGKKTLIIFGNNSGALTAITAAQDLAWRIDLKHKITAAPSLLHDEEEERMVIGTIGGMLFCVSENGEIVWQFATQGSIYSAASVADINNDKKPEVLFGSCDNNVYALTSAGQRIWSYETDFWVTTTPIVADIDEDGKLEVVIGSYDHNVYILDSQGAYVLDYVPGLSGIVTQAGHYSNILTSDPGQLTGKKLYHYKTTGIVVGCSLLHRDNDKPALIVNVKNGQTGSLRHED